MSIVFQREHPIKMMHYITTTGSEYILDFVISPAIAITSPREPQGPTTGKNRKSQEPKTSSWAFLLEDPRFHPPTSAWYPI